MNGFSFLHQSKVTVYALAACGLIALMLLVPAQTIHASSYVVTNTNDSGAGSLRQAILDANANTGADTITFDIGTGTKTITPLSALPQVTDAVTIDGTSQPGYSNSPLIELDGTSAGYGVIGLDIASDNCTIQGLVINRFYGVGIQLVGSHNQIQKNFIGLDVAGKADYGNSSSGIFVNATAVSADNGIRENVIAGNDWDGITIQGSASGTVIQGNKIGTTADGLGKLANVDNAIQLGPGGSNTFIGGENAGEGNLLSGNGWNGISVYYTTGNTLIQGNLIGTDITGVASLGNFATGVWTNSAGVTIGGTTAAARNVISSNWVGISLYASDGAVVQGNFIGTNKDGTDILGNSYNGVWVNTGAVSSQIGGTSAGARNVISGNGQLGIYVSDSGTNNTHIEGNRIGTSANGYAQIGNGYDGIYLNVGTTNTTIGGTIAGAGNVISGNGLNGIDNNHGATMVVQGNRIGTNVAGDACIPNAGEGIFMADGATIGGTLPDAGNVIACNGSDGIEVCGSGSCPEVPRASRANNSDDTETTRQMNAVSNPSLANPISGLEAVIPEPRKENSVTPPHETTTNVATIQNNYIGTDVTGKLNLGNAEEGIVLWYIDGNEVSDNVIAFNPGYGVHLASGANNLIQHNTISSNGKDGIYITGNGSNTLLENSIVNSGRDGMRVEASNNQINNNTIASNAGNGILIAVGTGNALRGNSITSNGVLGIDLAPEGVNPNDVGDKDKGVNKKQNYPTLTAASAQKGRVSGTLNSLKNKSFTIQFFMNEKCDTNGYGEGKTVLGLKTVKTDGFGNNTFKFKATGLVVGKFVSATATDANGNTSEFSKCVKVK